MGYVNILWNTLGDATGPLTKKSCSGCLQIGIPLAIWGMGKMLIKRNFIWGRPVEPISKPSIVKFSGVCSVISRDTHGLENRLRPNTLTLLTYLTLNRYSKTLPWSTDLCKRWVNMCWPNNNPWYGKKVVRKVTSLLVLSASRVSHFMPWFTIIIFTFDIVRL